MRKYSRDPVQPLYCDLDSWLLTEHSSLLLRLQIYKEDFQGLWKF